MPRLIKDNTKINFMGKRLIYFSISVFLVLASIGLVAIKGLNLGIDFTGGILIETKFKEAPKLEDLRGIFAKTDIGEVSLQTLGLPTNILIRIGQKEEIGEKQIKTIEQVKSLLEDNFKGQIEYRKIDYVGPKVGRELIKSGALALVIALVAMMLYIWFRFEWFYGVGGIVCLIHDAILTIGFYSLTGLDFNLSSIAAILTVVGYSINDSVVIFDRIRDDLRKYKKLPLDELINNSLNSTLSRTIMTSSTTMLALLALVILGGSVLYSFSLATLFGIAVGTYSSIYIGTPILMYLKVHKPS